jgi:hypothetical protein
MILNILLKILLYLVQISEKKKSGNLPSFRGSTVYIYINVKIYKKLKYRYKIFNKSIY